MTDAWDALVIGAGPAGAVAAATLARRKFRTLLVDRASGPGVTGGAGLLTGRDRIELSSGSAEPVPTERAVSERRWFFLDRRSSFSIDARVPVDATTGASLSTARRRSLEPWLVERARDAGAEVRWGVPVDRLDAEASGQVVGANVGGTSIPARMTLVCDPQVIGVLPLSKLVPSGGKSEQHAWVTVNLDAGALERRFAVSPGAGSAFDALLGFVEPPVMARGYVWTHRDALTVGVAVRSPQPLDPAPVLDQFREHPALRGYLHDTAPVERGSFARPLSRSISLGGPGFLAAGDAAGFHFENGIVHQELGYGIRSARTAAETAALFLGGKTPSPHCSAAYRRALASAGVLVDLSRSEVAGRRVEWNPRWHHQYPRLTTEVFHRMMTETSQPKEPVAQVVKAALKSARVRRRDLARDLLMAGGSL